MTATVDNAAHGTAEVSAASVREGNSATFTATSNTGYKFVNWTNTSTSTVVSTGNPYTIASVSESVSLTANFTEAKQVTYSGYSSYNGTRTDNFGTEYADDADKFTTPTNLYLSSDNQTLTGWNDGTTTYAVGDEIDCSAGEKTLTPVFTANSGASFAATLEARTAAFEVTWNLGNSYAEFNVESKTAYYVQQATIAGATVDIPMYINATSGKVNNANRTDAYSQTNSGTVFTLPVMNGAVVTINSYAEFSTTTINGSTDYDKSNSNKTTTYTYSGSTGTIDIVLGGDVQYISNISVSYPAPSFDITYDDSVENGSVSGEEGATVGETVSVTVTPDSGYEFDALVIAKTEDGTDVTDDCSVSSNTFVMPGYAVTVSATFTALPIVTLPTSSKAGYSCTGTPETPTSSGYTLKDQKVYAIAANGNITLTVPSTTAVSKIVISGTTQDSSHGATVTISGTNDESTNGSFNNRKGAEVSIEFTPTTQTTTYTLASASYASWVKISIYGTEHEAVTTAAGRYYATHIAANDLDFTSVSSDVTAYIATGLNDAGTAVIIEPVSQVPANAPILVKTATEGATVNVPLATSTPDALTTNLFVQGDGKEINTATDADTYYYLAENLFHKAISGTLKSGKAYLKLEGVAPASAHALTIGFDDEATGIQTVGNEVKGLLDGEFYNIAGQRMAMPKKGLYIVNGKKVLVK